VDVDEGREVFRAGVGLVVADDTGRVLAFERADVPGAWQLPQGGLLPGEDVEVAAWRELREETGLGEREVVLDAVSDTWTAYELPDELRRPKTGRGQVHRWVLFRLRPGATLPDLPGGRKRELRDRRWVTLDELTAGVVPFRRAAYASVADWLAPRLEP
jgi:putative (di)nucleoside polyphosphate hydrolase